MILKKAHSLKIEAVSNGIIVSEGHDIRTGAEARVWAFTNVQSLMKFIEEHFQMENGA